MKAIWTVFRRDVHTLRSNVMASLIVSGVILIPLIFTWFNVLASWAPLENTAGLKVAVASEDSGFDSNLMPTTVNIGNEVLSALRANEQLDWVITDKTSAIEGTKSGEYYAAIIIPQTFSQDILSFYSTNAHPTSIELYSNEKKNALAPKITDQGAQGVSHQVAEEFTRTLGDVSLGLVASLTDYLSQDEASVALKRIETRAEWVESQLRTSAGTARAFADLLESSVPLVESAENIANAPLPQRPDVNIELNISADDLTSAVDATISSYDTVQKRIEELYSTASHTHVERKNVLNDLAEQVKANVIRYEEFRSFVSEKITPVLPDEGQRLTTNLDQAIAAQKAVQQRLESAASSPTPARPDLSAVAEAQKVLAQTRQTQLPQTIASLRSSIEDIRRDLTFHRSTLDIDTSGLDSGSASVRAIAVKLDETADKFAHVRQAVASAANSGNLETVSALVGTDPSALAASIASPVEVEREVLFPVAAFGVGMAPLYTTLALWMGCLLAGVSLKTEVTGKGRQALIQYFGRFGIFAVIALAQSTCVGLGLLNFVKIEPAHPFLLLLSLWTSSLVFMLIVYTFVIAFSNAGKALGVLLLVFQISAAGGAYPLELLPQWFQNLSPWLPATYTIRAFQAASAGIYDGDYWKALGVLVMFCVPALVLGTLLRQPLASYNTKLTATLESTKLM